MQYTIQLTSKEPIVPVAVFENEQYALLGEFLLAERGLHKHFLAKLNELTLSPEATVEESGNAFTMTANAETAVFTNDITQQFVTADTAGCKQLLLDYLFALRELHVKEAMQRHKHHHDHHHS